LEVIIKSIWIATFNLVTISLSFGRSGISGHLSCSLFWERHFSLMLSWLPTGQNRAHIPAHGALIYRFSQEVREAKSWHY